MSIASRIETMEQHIEQAYDELQGLGADLTGIDKNIDNIADVLDDIYDDLPKVTGSGTSITLDDTRVGKIKSTLKGNTSQTGTPTPTSPIPVNVVSGDNEINVCGKNLFDIGTSLTEWFQTGNNGLTVNNMTISRTTATISGNTLTVNSYDTQGYTWISKWLPLNKNTDYIISGVNDNDIRIVGLSSTDLNTVGTLITTKTSSNTTKTFNSGDYNYYCLSFYPGTTGKHFENVQIEKGSSASIYEPYQANTYNIDLPTENKFDISKITENTYLSYDGTTGASSVTNLSDYMQILPSKPCTISYTYTTLMNTSQRSYCWYTENKTYISGDTYIPSNAPTTITAPSNAKYIRFAYDKNCTNIQLQQSSKATPYGTTPMELCSSPDGTLRDYFLHDKPLDKWYWHREIGKAVLNGSENISIYNQNTSRTNFQVDVLTGIENYLGNYVVPNLLSNMFNVVSQSASWVVGNISRRKEAQTTLYLTYEPSTTIDQFKAWLSTNNVNVYYIYATPTNEEITYQPLIDQLNELERAMSKDGQTNISQVNNDLPFIISASALKEWSV